MNLNKGYGDYLTKFLSKKWISFPIIAFCFAMIALFLAFFRKKLLLMTTRSLAVSRVLATPEGATYDYTDRFMQAYYLI